jgi:large subunit ribosomal protein L18
MEARTDRRAVRRRSRHRIRKKIRGSVTRPRLAVFRSDRHIYVQVIDDEAGRTIAQASTLDEELRGSIKGGGSVAAAKAVGTAIAQRLKQGGIEAVVFDRGGFAYHGRIKALADAARSAGLRV